MEIKLAVQSTFIVVQRLNEDLLKELGSAAEPSPEIVTLCEKIRKTIKDKRPPDEDSLLKKSNVDAPAQEAGNSLNQTVDSDTAKVQAGYKGIGAPTTGTPQQVGVPLPEVAASVPATDIASERAVPNAVPAEEVSLDTDTTASQQRLTDAGMTTEPANLVKEGPIAEARAKQGELGESAKTDPAAVLMQQNTALTASREKMQALQNTALAALRQSRTRSVNNTTQQQGQMKNTEGVTRESIGKKAEKLFKTAQDEVTPILNDLPTLANRKAHAS